MNRIENPDPELPELVILVVGRSLLPYCHFDVPESDYLSEGRRDAKLPGPIDYQAAADGSLPADTRVIEFNVVGIGETHVRYARCEKFLRTYESRYTRQIRECEFGKLRFRLAIFSR